MKGTGFVKILFILTGDCLFANSIKKKKTSLNFSYLLLISVSPKIMSFNLLLRSLLTRKDTTPLCHINKLDLLEW